VPPHPPTPKKRRGVKEKTRKKKEKKSRVIGYIHFTPLYEAADYIYTPVSLTTGGLCQNQAAVIPIMKSSRKN